MGGTKEVRCILKDLCPAEARKKIKMLHAIYNKGLKTLKNGLELHIPLLSQANSLDYTFF